MASAISTVSAGSSLARRAAIEYTDSPRPTTCASAGTSIAEHSSEPSSVPVVAGGGGSYSTLIEIGTGADSCGAAIELRAEVRGPIRMSPVAMNRPTPCAQPSPRTDGIAKPRCRIRWNVSPSVVTKTTARATQIATRPRRTMMSTTASSSSGSRAARPRVPSSQRHGGRIPRSGLGEPNRCVDAAMSASGATTVNAARTASDAAARAARVMRSDILPPLRRWTGTPNISIGSPNVQWVRSRA